MYLYIYICIYMHIYVYILVAIELIVAHIQEMSADIAAVSQFSQLIDNNKNNNNDNNNHLTIAELSTTIHRKSTSDIDAGAAPRLRPH